MTRRSGCASVRARTRLRFFNPSDVCSFMLTFVHDIILVECSHIRQRLMRADLLTFIFTFANNELYNF